jgi:hypothetical protein
LFQPKVLTVETRTRLARSALMDKVARVVMEAYAQVHLGELVLVVAWDERGDFVSYELEASPADDAWLRPRLDPAVRCFRVPRGETGLTVRMEWGETISSTTRR